MKVYAVCFWDEYYKRFDLYGGLDTELYSSKRKAQKRCDYLNNLFQVKKEVYEVYELELK
jgi:hypothetical protein